MAGSRFEELMTHEILGKDQAAGLALMHITYWQKIEVVEPHSYYARLHLCSTFQVTSLHKPPLLAEAASFPPNDTKRSFPFDLNHEIQQYQSNL